MAVDVDGKHLEYQKDELATPEESVEGIIVMSDDPGEPVRQGNVRARQARQASQASQASHASQASQAFDPCLVATQACRALRIVNHIDDLETKREASPRDPRISPEGMVEKRFMI